MDADEFIPSVPFDFWDEGENKCRSCGSKEGTLLRCTQCKAVMYCGRECQTTDWKKHRKECKKWKEESEKQARSRLTAGNWTEGLSESDKYEWICNCYQLRCDDDYVYGNAYLHGPYTQEINKLTSLIRDFKVFCLLAKGKEVIPSKGWNWGAFLTTAAHYIRFAFEKKDAVERWGSESVSSIATGERNLRSTARKIYGKINVSGMVLKQSGDEKKALQALKANEEKILRKIGGKNAWLNLTADLHAAGFIDEGWSEDEEWGEDESEYEYKDYMSSSEDDD